MSENIEPRPILCRDMRDLMALLPKCLLHPPIGGSWTQEITDKNGEMVGHIDWLSLTVVVYEEYEHCKAICKAIEGQMGVKVYPTKRLESDEEYSDRLASNLLDPDKWPDIDASPPETG